MSPSKCAYDTHIYRTIHSQQVKQMCIIAQIIYKQNVMRRTQLGEEWVG